MRCQLAIAYLLCVASFVFPTFRIFKVVYHELARNQLGTRAGLKPMHLHWSRRRGVWEGCPFLRCQVFAIANTALVRERLISSIIERSKRPRYSRTRDLCLRSTMSHSNLWKFGQNLWKFSQNRLMWFALKNGKPFYFSFSGTLGEIWTSFGVIWPKIMLDVLWFEKNAPEMKWSRFFVGHFSSYFRAR